MIRAFIALTKPAILRHAILTLLLGYVVGSFQSLFSWYTMFFLVVGFSFLAGGAAALNHYLERDLDALMSRTRTRPLPMGTIKPEWALVYCIVLVVLGTGLLTFFVNVQTGVLGLLLLVLYDFVYTPLKRVTWLNTFVGAVPGAMPPLCGWVAATGTIDLGCLSLVSIFYMWQLPHFFALAWMYKDSYQQAGLKMLSVFDETGAKTLFWIVFTILLLIGASVLPVVMGLFGRWYLGGVFLLGVLFLWSGLLFVQDRSFEGARRVMRMSIVYQPMLFVLIILDVLL